MFMSNLVKNGLYLAFISRHSFMISDNFFLLAHGFIFDGILSIALYTLPVLVLMIKIAPKGIEGTTLAALMGIRNLSISAISPLGGSFLNDSFVGVTKSSMNGYQYLTLIPMALSIPWSVLVVRLLPTKKSVEEF